MNLTFKRLACVSLLGILFLTGCGQAQQTAVTAGKETSAHSENEISSKPSDAETVEKKDDGTAEVDEGNVNTGEKGDDDMAATLLYQGHGSVRIVTGEGKVIYIDPFMGDGYDLPADLILMTHGHYDHTREELISEKNEGCNIIKWSDALKNGEYQDYDLGFVSVETVEAGYNVNHNVSECVGFILTFSDGVKVYFSGDTSTTPSMAGFADKNIDYAFLCCDGVYNMDVDEASECAKLIGAKHTIPYHMEPVKDNSGFDMSVAERFDAPGKIIVEPGEELVLK